MRPNEKLLQELYHLFVLSVEGEIKEQQFTHLEKAIVEDKEVRKCYLEFLTTYVGLTNFEGSSQVIRAGDGPVIDEKLWQALAENEKTAAALEIEKPKENSQETVFEKAPVPKPVYKINKVAIVTAITSIAALVIILVYVCLNPRHISPLVAKLTDTVDIKWDDQDHRVERGDDLRAGTMKLKKGYAEITFDCGAEVIVEGPAEIELEKVDQMRINYGRLYATVPSQALGFTISSPNTKIIDLGTEFGVEVGLWGATQLHVMRGRTILISGTNTGVKTKYEVSQGQAKKVSANGTIQDVSLKSIGFVRQIDSDKKFIWNGRTVLSLADIVGGGNGLGTGRSNIGIDPLTGTYQKRIEGYEREGNSGYIAVEANPLIDGVFIPDFKKDGFVVSSEGHRYKGFCDTNNKAWIEICNGLAGSSVDFERHRAFQQGIRLDGRLYSNNDKSFLVIHSNSGITFDLEAIRRVNPQVQLDSFEVTCGIPDQIKAGEEDYWAEFDIHVLLDGQKCFYKEAFRKNDGQLLISIPIQPDIRFLTIAVTDAGNENHGDYAVFAEPQLIMLAE